MRRLLLLKFILLSAIVAATAQQKAEDHVTVVKADANACELNSAYVDMFRNAIATISEQSFIIFRPGDGETAAVNNRRFSRISQFLKKTKGLISERTIYATGEKIAGQGRIEFYVGGNLMLVILSKRGKMPCMDCCD